MSDDPVVTAATARLMGTAPAEVDPAHALDLKLFTVLSRAHAAVMEHPKRDVARLGLTLSEFAVLEVLFHRGPVLLGEIGSRILASSGGITYLVDRLVTRGFVERQECASDRRARYAVLTESGVRFMEGIFPQHAEAIAHGLGGLSREEKEAAIALLRKLGLGARDRPPLAPG